MPAESQPESSSQTGLTALWKKHGSKVLLVFAAAMLVFAGVRYKRNQDAQRSLDARAALANAWRGVEQVQSEQFSMTGSSPAMAAIGQQIEVDVNQAVQLVLDGSDAATDAPRLASAWLARGELFWALGHMIAPTASTGPSTAPSTQPTSQPAASQPAKDYLSLAATAYGKIVSDYSAQIEPLTIARFGLAAVAEDRRDIPAARLQYQALIDNAAVAPPDKSMAETRLASLNELEKPLLLLPATQPVAAVMPTSIQTTINRLGPPDASASPAASQPSTQPTK